MPYSIIKGTPEGVVDKLNGAYVLGPFPETGLPVGTLTIIFTQPAALTVTFTGAANEVRTMEQIKDEINSDLSVTCASLRTVVSPNQPVARTYVEGKGDVVVRHFYLVLQHDTNGIVITGGTARSLFGIPTSGTVTFTATDPTKVKGFVPDGGGSHYLALISP